MVKVAGFMDYDVRFMLYCLYMVDSLWLMVRPRWMGFDQFGANDLNSWAHVQARTAPRRKREFLKLDP